MDDQYFNTLDKLKVSGRRKVLSKTYQHHSSILRFGSIACAPDMGIGEMHLAFKANHALYNPNTSDHQGDTSRPESVLQGSQPPHTMRMGAEI